MRKHKVVYNTAVCGGIALSEKAVAWLKERGFKEQVEPNVLYCYLDYMPQLTRHDPLLVECVETLGDDANGIGGEWVKTKVDLHVATIVGNYYYIDDHDGAGEEVIDITKMIDASE